VIHEYRVLGQGIRDNSLVRIKVPILCLLFEFQWLRREGGFKSIGGELVGRKMISGDGLARRGMHESE
jgi:hypothetical protein